MSILIKYPTVVSTEEVAPESNNDWDSPDNVKLDDAYNASITAATFDSPDISYRIKCQGFDFSAIPDGVVIRGIVVEIQRYCDAGETGADYRVQLLDASGALVGDNKAKAGDWGTVAQIHLYGGPEDSWNAGLTSAMVKDTDFGVVLSASATSSNADIYVDYIRMTVYYGAIDIGSDAIDRNTYASPLYTFVDVGNPSNGTGTLDAFEVWAVTGNDILGFKVGTFYGSGTSYTSRDVETIGNVTSGSKQTFTNLSCNVTTGDYIGSYWVDGQLESSNDQGTAIYYKSGDQFGAGTQTYTYLQTYAISMYGMGTESGAPPLVIPMWSKGILRQNSLTIGARFSKRLKLKG